MRVFVAGATGAVGSRLIPLLVSAGHSVLGLTRTPSKAEAIRRVGGDVAVVDALDGVAVRQAVISAKPDVIVHEMTALSSVSDVRRLDRVFALTNRLRTEGLDHLLAAAKQAGTRRVVVQSFGGWPFARTGGPVKTEQDPLDPEPPKQLRRTLDAIRYLESKTTGAFEGEGLVLRYGAFYGPGTGMLDRSMIDQLRRRRVPLLSRTAPRVKARSSLVPDGHRRYKAFPFSKSISPQKRDEFPQAIWAGMSQPAAPLTIR
jgi:nucleoside-diphosphate-sugar epimerase